MDAAAMKEDLHRGLRDARATLVWKVEGLSEYDRRRPLTMSGTNMLGLVKHLTLVELLHLGWVYGRPHPQPPSWCVYDTSESDFWALPDQSCSYLLSQYRMAAAHADETVQGLALDAPGTMPWGEATTLHHTLVHVLGDVQRHLGHADILREAIDGVVGESAEGDGIRSRAASWVEQHAEIERAARDAVGVEPPKDQSL